MDLVDRVRAEVRKSSKAVATRSTIGGVTTIDDYISLMSSFQYQNNWYQGGIQQTLGGEPAEYIGYDLDSFARQAYAENGPIFALMGVRMMAFSAIRFQWQPITNGRPGALFGNPALSLLERPWSGGTTQDLLTRMITDADLAGNAYFTVRNGELVHLRPDWVGIVLAPRIPDSSKPDEILGYTKIGYIYQEGGFHSAYSPILLPANEVCHFAPHPDPLATYRGMSWLTPVIRDLANDKLMQKHQRKFFENGATPNMIVRLDAAISYQDFLQFKEDFNLQHKGAENAYKTLFVGGGADATVVGADFQQMSFTATQGRGETRLAAAAGVPVTIVGFSEGLQGSSLNAGNFAQARRRLADLTMHPLWGNAAGSLEILLSKPNDNVRLWYNDRDVPFLREDAKDAALIMQIKAEVLNKLVSNGWTPESAKAVVLSEDFSLIEHTGLLSVQLQPPGSQVNQAQPSIEQNPPDNGGQ